MTEDFLGYENLSNETGQLGDWQLVNNNGATKGGLFNDLVLPNDGQVAAWELINPELLGITNTAFADKNGSFSYGFLISNYNYDEATDGYPDNDDWLISPVLPGVEQTISFDVKALSVSYGAQTYQVLYSTTDDALESFKELATVELSDADWHEESFSLPAGATYFAIRNITDGDSAFGIMVSYISFSTAGGGEVASYNVYLDQTLSQTAQETKALVEDVDDGDHIFSVTAVYANGAESLPVSVAVSVTTAIEQLVATGKPVNIYTVDGKLVRANVTSTEGLKSGLYIVNGKKVSK